MTVQLRQICLVARELSPVIDDLTDILGINPCFIDPAVGAHGLENTLMPIGRNFLEVVAPIEDNTAGGRYLDRRNGDGGYMVITHIDNLPQWQTIRQSGLENGVRIAAERQRDGWHLCQLHPRDLIASFLEIDWDPHEALDGHWNPVGGFGWEDKVRQDVTVDFLAVELQGPDPVALAELWSKVLGIPLNDGELSLSLNNVSIRFVSAEDGRGPGLGGLDIAVADRAHVLRRAKTRGCYVNDDRVDICGTRFNLIDALATSD